MTTTASELASDYVRECLGFANPASRVRALHKIQDSLQSCFYDDDAGPDAVVAAERPTAEWRRFLEGGGCDDDGGGGGEGGGIDAEDDDFVLRDGLIRCLVEGCHPGGGDEDDDDDEDAGAGAEDGAIVESSFICLTYLVSLRSPVERDGGGGGGGGRGAKGGRTIIAPIFGPDFATAISADVVLALRSDLVVDHDDGDDDDDDDEYGGIPRAASDLLVALLRPDRPRNEACSDEIREHALLPACRVGGATAVARVARVLSSFIVSAVGHAVPDGAGCADGEELSMRRETAALGRLQDMRDVMHAVGTECSRCLLLLDEEGEEEKDRRCGRRILNALREIHAVAAYAVESQLETLLDEGASPILSRLCGDDEGRASGADDDDDAARRDAMDDDDDDDVEDGKESELVDACALAPLYANIARPPVLLTTLKHLDSMLLVVAENLGTVDAELWDDRLDALVGLECILAGGVASMSPDARYLFIERLRLMPLHAQFTDLRSQITHQACRLIVATAYEYRDYVAEDPQLNQMVSQFVESCIPSILTLCMSGTRLMSAQGTSCLTCLASVCGGVGYPRVIPRLCDEILGPKVHKNRKRGSAIALACALRVWDPTFFPRHLDQLFKATKEGATNRDPTVREEGRKLYWAMRACCDETDHAVRGMFDSRSREMKNLEKEREAIDSEWEDGGAMSVLVRTGVLGRATEVPAKVAVTTKARIPATDVPLRSNANAKRSASARLMAQHGTPFKSQKISTPTKSASAGGVLSAVKRPPPNSSASARISTPNIESKSSGSKSINCNNMIPSKMSRARPSTAPAHLSREEKENSLATPIKSVGFSVNSPASLMSGSPLVDFLARSSPLSAKELKNPDDIIGEIISMLSNRSPHEQSLGIKALALFAKENPLDPSWDDKFSAVMSCLLDHLKNMPTINIEDLDFISSPTNTLSCYHQMQHSFLQGVRSLLEFVPSHVKSDQVKGIIQCMLECTRDAPFEIVHTAERALVSLVTSADPETCFEHLIPYTRVEIDLNDKVSPPELLSTLRTMIVLVDRIPIDSLRRVLPSLLDLFHAALCHKSVDMRKATVFILVEMHFVLGDELRLDEFTDCHQRLVRVYVERHPKNSRRTADAGTDVPTPPTQKISA